MIDAFTIQEVMQFTKGKLLGSGEAEVRYLASDSRALSGTSEVLFIAISGPRHNGNDYIDEVYNKGVRSFLTDQEPKTLHADASYIIVKNALESLQEIAAAKRKAFEGRVIAVTGSNGKTIVKEWLYQIMQQSESVYRSPRSYNSQLGVPLSTWQITENYSHAIIEAGISEPGEMHRLGKIICPEIGILTNIGSAHSENFESDSQKLQEKLTLFKDSECLIYCADQEVDQKSISEFMKALNGKYISWSVEGRGDYNYSIQSEEEARIVVRLEHEGESMIFYLPFADRASVENLLHCITALLELNIPDLSIQQGLDKLEPVAMRLETLDGIHNSRVVNDVYNSDLAGLSTALDVLFQQKRNRSKIVILSELFQSGLEEQELYEIVADMLSFRKVQQVYLIGDSISRQKALFPSNTKFYKNTEEFLSRFNTWEIEDAAVLIKGARRYRFEEITRLLELRVHRTVLEIDINELIYNLNFYRSQLAFDVQIMVMVKALSYGSGSDEIAGYLQHEKVDYLAVAFPDEGIELRDAGIDLPIMVMNTDARDFSTLLDHNLEPEIYSRDGLIQFQEQCKFLGKEGHPIHLKLDTGMHRLGFVPEDLEWLCGILKSENIVVKSIFSHLAASEEPALDSFTREQAEKFQMTAAAIELSLGYSPVRHLLNSAGIERFPEYHFNMVRLGIGLHGYGISEELVPVSTYKTAISQVKIVKTGETIGYGRSGILTKDSLIATIPVGYADGINRKLGNGNFSFYLNGQLVPTIGNICMDMTMLDITGVKAEEGDIVELFGNNLPVQRMAEKLDTIVYEILTSIPERVKRIYIRE